jgi:hypothetical protein
MKPGITRKEIHKSLDRVLDGAKGDGRVVATVVLKGEEIKEIDVCFRRESKYLSSIGKSPEDPLAFGLESYCSAFAGIIRKKIPAPVDPLGILKETKGKEKKS